MCYPCDAAFICEFLSDTARKPQCFLIDFLLWISQTLNIQGWYTFRHPLLLHEVELWVIVYGVSDYFPLGSGNYLVKQNWITDLEIIWREYVLKGNRGCNRLILKLQIVTYPYFVVLLSRGFRNWQCFEESWWINHERIIA